ncbi:MAG: hypothetical protein SFU53_11620 [Terrimicrobiaceae bacterium]|nr:hypothetical protein [Terrimicrobiaceae bacterium]
MKTAVGFLVFAVCATLGGLVAGFLGPGLRPVLAAGALGTGLVLGAAAWIFCSRPERRIPGPLDWLVIAVFLLASARAFLWLIYPAGNEWRVLSPNNLGDMALHLQFIRYLASGVAFWPASPILSGVPMSYPIGADLFNSLLLLVGVPVERGLIWVGLAGAAVTLYALWRWGGAFAIAALIFNGGLAGFLVFQTGQIQDFQADVAWKNFFLSMFVTQRGLLFALPAGLLLLHSWREIAEGRAGLPFVVQWLLYASMPLFNAHAFVFLSLLLAALFLGLREMRGFALRLVGAAFVPASVLVTFVTGYFSAGAGVRFLPGWMQADGGFVFWLINFGALLIALPWLAWAVRRDRIARCFVATGLVVFVLCLLFSFSKWEWDNMKLFLWAWLVCVPWLWSAVIRPLPAIARAAACFLLFFSGAVSLAGGLDGRHGYGLASRSELADVAYRIRLIPPTDRFTVDPRYNHPIILLGRPVYCGYDGHLWSHGLDYTGRMENLRAILRRDPDWMERVRGLDAEWVYFEQPGRTIIPAGARAPSNTSESPGP